MSEAKWKFLFFGAGVVGGSVGGLVARHYDEIYFYDKPEIAQILKTKGIALYHQGEKEKTETVKVNVVDSLDQIADAGVIVLGVKNYSLEPVAKMLKEKFGDKPIIVSMANGMDNQKILPKYFSKVIYCVVCYNGWMDAPGVIGYQNKGPLVIGTPDNRLQSELKEVSMVFNLGMETIITPHLQDAVHSKIVLNLSNSVTTLLGPDFKDIPDRNLMQKIFTSTLSEGIQIIKAAGYKECKLGGMPSWLVIGVAGKLPRFITKNLFEKNVKKMVMSSMAQDVIVRGSTDNELDSINGRILELADKHGIAAPYNRAIYELAKGKFSKPEFKPINIDEMWAAVKSKL